MKTLVQALLVLLFAGSALAAPTVNKDWMVDQGPDEVIGKDSCLAATNVSAGTHRSQLLLSFPKDRLALPQLLYKVWDAPAGESVLKVRISSKVSHPLFVWKASTQPDQPTIYWYAPIGWNDLLDIIVGANNLNIQGITLQNQISLRGSSASLDQIEKCLKTSSVLPTEFLKQLNVKSTLNEAVYASVDEWVKALEQTFETYRTGLAKTKARTELLKPVRKLIEQEAEALKSYETAQRRWQTVSDELKAKQLAEQALQQSLLQSKAELQTLQDQLVLAQDNLKVKKAAYEPARAQIEILEKNVSVAERALNSNISETKHLQNRIASIEKEIPDLRDERDSLDRKINRLQGEIDTARREYDDADWKARRYDVDAETRSDLLSDWRYNDLRRRYQQAMDDARRFNSEANKYQNQADRAKVDLHICQRDPHRDCSSYAILVQELTNKAQQARSRANQAERDAWTAQSQADYIERETRHRHEYEKRRLMSIRDDYARKLFELQNQQNTARSRRTYIDNKIPDLQAELKNAKAKLLVLQGEKPALETALADARQRLEQAKVSLDIARLEKEYTEAIAQVNSLTKSVAVTQKKIVDTEKSLKDIKSEIADLSKDLARRTATRDQAEQKLAAIRAELNPIRDQEVILNKEIADLAQLFEQGKARYQKTYESLLAQ